MLINRPATGCECLRPGETIKHLRHILHWERATPTCAVVRVWLLTLSQLRKAFLLFTNAVICHHSVLVGNARIHRCTANAHKSNFVTFPFSFNRQICKYKSWCYT